MKGEVAKADNTFFCSAKSLGKLVIELQVIIFFVFFPANLAFIFYFTHHDPVAKE